MGCREHKRFVRTASLFQMRHISVLHELVYIHLARTQRTILTIQLIFQARFVGQLRIKIANTALISSGYNHRQKIGAHTRYETTIGYAIGQPSRIFIHLKMTADILRQIFRISQSPYQREVPLSAPYRIGIIQIEHRFVLGTLFHRELANAPVMTRVSPVDVARQTSA